MEVGESQFGRKVWLLYHQQLQGHELALFQLKSSSAEALRELQALILMLRGGRVALEGKVLSVSSPKHPCPWARGVCVLPIACPHPQQYIPINLPLLQVISQLYLGQNCPLGNYKQEDNSAYIFTLKC